tara:strand:- start:210 stop:1208 length:999 start_codon:yes stop_codon:yes gene_type:complete
MTKLIYKAFIFAFITISSFVYADQLDDSYVLGFGSCITEKRDQPIWKAIEKENINEFFFMGDNVYGDSKDGLLKEMEISYMKQKDMFPKWLYTKKLNAIWDDHDYGKNDGGAEYPLKEQAQRLFLEFWNVDKDDARYSQKGIYFNEEKVILNNKINLIALDTRYHRSSLDQEDKPYYPTTDETKTMLGKDQWKWFEEILKIDSDIIIIVSSIQVLPTNHIFEKWHNFPHERSRLLGLLKFTNKPVIILSGDRHKAGLYKKDNIIEITSSSLNKPISRPLSMIWDIFSKESDELLIRDMYYQENYGLLKILPNKKMIIQLKDMEGKEIFSYKM